MQVVPLQPMSQYDENPGAVGTVSKPFDVAGYEHLNIYDSLDEPPAPPATGKPKAPAWRPPVKPKPKKKPRSSLDSEGYLKF